MGNVTSSGAFVTFDFYIPENDASGNPVINLSTGVAAPYPANTATVTATWNDVPDTVNGKQPSGPAMACPVSESGSASIIDKAIAIQKPPPAATMR